MKKRSIPECFVQQAMEAVGGKWRILTLQCLAGGSTSFGSLKRAMPSITERMLALQLRELHEDGLIERIVETERPLRVSYAFTPLGETLVPLASAMYQWGLSHGKEFVAHRSMANAAS
jgi:DNA-binding HxlR family transcriptional regulator